MSNEKHAQLKTFADVCAKTGKNEQDYVVAESATNGEKATNALKRVRLIAKAFNGDEKPKMADTDQYKYMPWFEIIPDESKPSGFGLSYVGYGCVDSDSFLGARPYFLGGEDARYAGKQFISEFEAWAQYDDMVNQED